MKFMPMPKEPSERATKQRSFGIDGWFMDNSATDSLLSTCWSRGVEAFFTAICIWCRSTDPQAPEPRCLTRGQSACSSDTVTFGAPA